MECRTSGLEMSKCKDGSHGVLECLLSHVREEEEEEKKSV